MDTNTKILATIEDIEKLNKKDLDLWAMETILLPQARKELEQETQQLLDKLGLLINE